MKLLINEMDFKKCGEIVVSAKHNVFAMSCSFCPQRFSQLQTFRRHLQLQHADILEFAKKDKNIEVYAVEELMKTINQSSLEEAESEESVVAGDDGNWLTDEDQKWLDEGDADDEQNITKVTGLANMSILKALEDCDVSMNLVDNLDETNCETKDKDADSEKEEDDDILNNTMLKQIQNDWDVSDLEESQNKSAQSTEEHDTDDSNELKGDDTMTEIGLTCDKKEENMGVIDNIEDCLINNKALGLKGLLQGLEDLEDVDSLLENLEDSFAGEVKQNDSSNFINSKQIIKKYQTAGENDIHDTNIETPVLEDLELTVNHKDVSLVNEAVINYKLAIKNPKEKELPKSKNQQKMFINIESGELENINNELKQLNDSLEEENLIFNKFINSSNGENEKPKKEIKTKIESKQHQPKSPTNKQEESEEEDFEEQLKKMEELLENDNIISNKTPIKIPKTSQHQKKHLKNTTSNGREDFDLQLKNLEATLNEDNIVCTNLLKKNPQKDGKTIKNSHKPKINKDQNTKTSKKTNNQLDFEEQLQELEDNLDDCIQVQQITNIMENPQETEETPKEVPNKLNIDLTRALEEALEGDDLNLLNMEMDEDNEPPLNQDLKDLLAQELLEEVNEAEKPTQITNAIKSQTNIKNKKCAAKLKVNRDLKKEKSSYESRYEKTNLKAKNMRQQPLSEMKNMKTLEQHKKIPSKKSPLKTSHENRNPLKANHQLNLQQQPQILLKPKTPKKSPENQENLILRTRQGKPSIKEDMENFKPDFIKKIKNEKFTPQRSFINTERGDRTPLQTDEMFLKQSPKTQEKQQDIPENFTPKRGERTPKTKEQMFLKQSPKTKEKNNEELLHAKTPKRGNKTPKTRPHLNLQQSPKTQEKTENATKKKLMKTPGKLNLSPKLDEAFSRDCEVNVCRTSPVSLDKISPLKTSKQNSHLISVTTPQRMKNLTIKLPRLTPVKLKQNANNDRNMQLPTIKSPQSSTKTTNNKLLGNSENESQNKVFNGFKLPNGITLTKVTPSNNNKSNIAQSHLDETPIKTNYCKQNFSESSLEPQILKQPYDTNDIKFTLIQPENQAINSLNTKNSKTTLRQRKASIDIVPPLPKTQSKYAATKSTPKHSNLDYKSYSVNRSARKKEVLQRMRHIKKQIFKSIENGQQLIKFQRTKSPPNKPQKRKHKLQIENVQILPNIKREHLTPLINPFDNFKKPSANNVIIPPAKPKSPKNLNDDEKQAKKSLHVSPSASNSPINDDEKLIKKSLKRTATSPLLDEEKQAKRLQKSPSTHGKDGQRKSSDLETTQLGLSESVVDFLQRDLKANRLNVASILNEDFPTDDNSPNETSIESNGKETKTEDKAKETSNNNNILDDLLNQVDNEQKSNEESNDVQQKEKTTDDDETKPIKISNDFDETKDLNLLNKFGLQIIKTPDIEDLIPLEESDEMKQKAQKFADTYEHYQRIWSTKNGENSKTPHDLNMNFKQLLTQTNLTFKLDLNMNELKRLVNLITFWYSQNFNSKLIEKKKITEATNRYLLMFHYIPKTAKRLFYCEYCEEYFNTEHRYFTHRIVHTGALYPYQCIKCSMGFRLIKTHKDHELQCSGSTNTSCYKCPLCSETFKTSTLLYEHSKTHLKTAYNCVKCDLVFATAADVQKHMTLCNRNVKRIPKQLTPRPPKLRQEK